MAENISSLPIEVIDEIFGYLDIQDVAYLSRNARVDSNLGFCIAKTIRNGIFGYTNRVENVSFLGIYSLTPSFIQKSRLAFVPSEDLFLDMLRFCKTVGPNFFVNDLTISFYIWSLVDLIDFARLISKVVDIDSGNTFSIELEFDPALPHYINIAPILCQLFQPGFGKSVRSLFITNYTGPFDLNVSEFPDLERLWLINSSVKFKSSFQQNPKLKDLKIYPNMYGYRSNKFRVLRKSIAVNLTEVALGSVIIQPSSLNYPFPAQVRRINLRSVKDMTGGEYIFKLIHTNTQSGTLKKVVLEDLFDIEKNYHEQIIQLLNSYLPNLLDLGLSNLRFDVAPIADNWARTKLDRLNILVINRSQLSRADFGLCSTLRKLDLGDNNIKDIVNMKFPETLGELYFSNNPIDWTLGKVRFPPNLIRLSLKNTNIGKHLPLIELPDNIRVLSFEVNNLESIAHFKFPKRLQILGIGSNKLSNIDDHLLPVGLKVVHFTENRLSGPLNLRTNANGDTLLLKAVYINHNQFSRINEVQFPDSIRVVCLDENPLRSLKDYEFPPGLEELSVNGCDLREVKNVGFGENSRLGILTLMNNKLKTIANINIPSNIEILNFSFNNIETISPTAFKTFSRLIKLNLSNNKLKKVFLSLCENLKVIDLSNNAMKLLSLQFEKDVLDSTRLSSVNLSTNSLTSFSPLMLGLVEPIKHDNLIEIDLTENKIRPSAVDASQIPKSVKCFLIGTTGEQDQFGYDVGKNIIDFDLCGAKKIEGY